MAGASTHPLLFGGAVNLQISGSGVSKLCLFCLAPADYVPERSQDSNTDWTKTYFRQFLWKYLIGDDMVKINEFTGNQLKNTVPPLCGVCHEKCMQLASYHLEFENIQEEIMQVTKELLEGWKSRDTLFTRKEYDTVVQQCQRDKARPKMPTNRFIKSPGGNNGTGGAYPSLETLQMYQILRNPGHVRIPLSCLKSFGFTELKNLVAKSSSVAKQILSGPKLSPPSILQSSLVAKAAAAAKAINANNSLSISKIYAGTPPTAKKYWINDVQVEMLGPGNSQEDDDDYMEDDMEYEQKYIPPPKQHPPTSAAKRPPPPMKPAFSSTPATVNKLAVSKLAPPVPMLKQMPSLGAAPKMGSALNLKRPKLDPVPLDNPAEPIVEVDEYYDGVEDDGEDTNCVNFLEIVGNNGQQYEDDDETYTDSPEDSKYYYDDENGEESYSDDVDGLIYGDDGSLQQYYNGRPSTDGSFEDGNPMKKRKRVFVLRKGNWTQDEDEMISKIVTEAGPKNWSKVALQLGTGRTGKQIRERWTHHLNPEVNKQPWSEQEDLVLMQAHARWGNQWSRISKLLPGRTDNAVKNHWNGTLKRKAQLMQFDQKPSVDLLNHILSEAANHNMSQSDHDDMSQIEDMSQESPHRA